MRVPKVTLTTPFSEWLRMREDFHQGVGAMGASLPLKPKRKIRKYEEPSPNPMFNIDRGQSYQGTKRDDGNG